MKILNSNEFMDIDTAQFVLSLALNQMGMIDASIALSDFMGTNSETYTKGNNKLAGMTSYAIKDSRNQLEQELRKTGQGMLPALINYLWVNPVIRPVQIPQLTSYSRSDLGRMFTLAELTKRDVRVELYRKAMNFFLTVNKNSLIVKYIFTEHFKHFFRLSIIRDFSKSADAYRDNNLSDTTMSEILTSFSHRVSAYSANGTYSLDSGNPVAFLTNTLSFFKMSSDNGILPILNRVYSLTPIRSDAGGFSYLDVNGIANKEHSENINFIYLCYRISYASGLIFKFSGCALSDIITHYKETLLKANTPATLGKTLNKLLPGINVNLLTVQNQCTDNTQVVKLKARNRICDVMEQAMLRGFNNLALEDVYSELLAVTSMTQDRDGCRLFTVAGGSTRKSSLSNSEIFKALLDGYLAMSQLISFLESPANKTGVGLFELPVQIFRDPAYLTRFHTFEEYINYIDEVCPLVEEVKNDANRNREYRDGLLINDKVHSIISTRYPKKVNAIVQMIGSMPIRSFYAALKSTDTSTENAMFTREISTLCSRIKSSIVHSSLPTSDGVPTEIATYWDFRNIIPTWDVAALASYLCSMFTYKNNETGQCSPVITFKDVEIFTLAGNDAIRCMVTTYVSSLILKEICNQIDYPVVNENGMFLWDNFDLEEFQQKMTALQQANNTVVPELFPFIAIYTLVYGLIMFCDRTIDSSDFNISAKDAHSYWLMTTVLKYYVENLYKISNAVSGLGDSNYFIMLVRSVKYSQILAMNFDSVNFTDLSVLLSTNEFDDSIPEMYVPRRNGNLQVSSSDTRTEMLSVLKMILSYMKYTVDPDNCLNKLVSKINTNLQYNEEVAADSLAVTSILRNAANEIMSKPIVRTDRSIVSVLGAKYNNDDFLTKRGRLYHMPFEENGDRGEAYFHRSGYKIMVSAIRYGTYTYTAITDDDIKKMELRGGIFA